MVLSAILGLIRFRLGVHGGPHSVVQSATLVVEGPEVWRGRDFGADPIWVGGILERGRRFGADPIGAGRILERGRSNPREGSLE